MVRKVGESWSSNEAQTKKKKKREGKREKMSWIIEEVPISPPLYPS